MVCGVVDDALLLANQKRGRHFDFGTFLEFSFKMDEDTGRDYSFACAGWLKLYLFGVAKYLQEHDLIKNSRFIGSSAGALAATGLALDCDFEAIRDYVLESVIPQAHGSIAGAFSVRQYLTDCLTEHGHLEEFAKVNASQTLVISYTNLLTCSARRVSEFTSNEDLLTALLASCCATPIAGLPFKRGNEIVIDAGLTDFQPIFDERTITVSPFYCTNADIRPSRYVPMWWAVYPPSKENSEWLFDLGYDDAHAWAKRLGLVEGDDNKSPRSKASKYDGKWQTKLGRFTGYHALESQVLDIFFVVFVMFLWKPLALTLVYAELFLRAFLFAGTALMLAVACKLVLTLTISGVLASITPLMTTAHVPIITCIGATSVVLAMIVVLSGGMQSTADKAWKDWDTCRICLRNIGSLSLLLRALPGVGAAVPIKRHEFLLQHSFVYRLTNHFV